MKTTIEKPVAEKKAKPSLFAKAKDTGAVVAAKKDDKVEVLLSEKENPGISEKLSRLQAVKNEIDELEGEAKLLDGEIKQIGKDSLLKLYESGKRFPGSFKLKGEKGGCFLFITMDKYLTVDDAKADLIKSELGENIVEQKTTFSFNPDLLEKYEAVLSDLISNSKQIADEDKGNLIVATSKWNVVKGTLEKLYALFPTSIQKALNLVQPIYALKNCK